MLAHLCYAARIDQAFALLLVAKQMLDHVIPDSDDERARTMSAEFVAALIKAASDVLTPRGEEAPKNSEMDGKVIQFDSAANVRLKAGQSLTYNDIDRQIEQILADWPIVPNKKNI